MKDLIDCCSEFMKRFAISEFFAINFNEWTL